MTGGYVEIIVLPSVCGFCEWKNENEQMTLLLHAMIEIVEYYKENGIYKYTYGASTDYNKIYRMRKEILHKFKDAFIIAFKGDSKMNVQEAIQEFKRNRKK